jgi:hypothetical protein
MKTNWLFLRESQTETQRLQPNKPLKQKAQGKTKSQP